MKNIFNVCNLYIGLWGVYYLQGIFYPFGSNIAKLTLLVVLTISLYYWGYVNINYKLPRPLKYLNVFICLLTIYALVYQLSGDFVSKISTGTTLTAFDNIKAFCSALLPVYALYAFVRKGYLNEKVLIYWFLIILLITTGQFVVYEEVMLSRSIYNTDGLTNNIAYEFLAITPFLYFFRNKPVYMYSSALYIYTYIIWGMKRGAILIGIIALIIILFNHFKSSSFKKKIIISILSVVLIVILYQVLFELSANSSYFQYRLSKTMDGDSSGRDQYYQTFIDYFINQQDLGNLLIGNGTYSTVRLVGNLAHNDWFELLICNGLLGLFVYLSFWISLFKYKKTLKDPLAYNVINLFFIIFLLKTFFSMSYTSMGIFALMPVAYIMATPQKR